MRETKLSIDQIHKLIDLYVESTSEQKEVLEKVAMLLDVPISLLKHG